MQYHHSDSCRKPWNHTRLDFVVGGVPTSNQITSEIQSELNYRDSQHAFVSRNQRAYFECVSIITTHYTAEQTQLTRKEPRKSKFPADLWPGGQRGCPACIQRRFKQSLWLHYLTPSSSPPSTHQWTLGATTVEQTDQASLIHSPPRCLCQVIAGRKRKTDQYISHGPDR